MLQKFNAFRRITSLKTRRRRSRKQNRETGTACVAQGQRGRLGSQCLHSTRWRDSEVRERCYGAASIACIEDSGTRRR
jgi:hypothetical protein